MAAVANNPKFAKKVGVPQSVGREFANADKRNKDMPSKYDSTANKPGKAVKKYRGGGRTAADHRANLPLGNTPTRVSGGPGGIGSQARQLAQRAVVGAGKLGLHEGGEVHDKKVLRNLDDEVYRIADKERMGGAEGRDARDERGRINREKDYEKRQLDSMADGGKVSGKTRRRGDGPIMQRGFTRGGTV
jgi:hypothetical protein